jgi:hypothetical protein
MVFVFQSGRLGPKVKGTPAFKFLLVAGALLSKKIGDFLAGRKPAAERLRQALPRQVLPE